jgi:hypothetical protein
MRGRLPVQSHQFVSLSPGQPAAAARQRVEPLPVGPVRRNEGVEIHGWQTKPA